jgi:hypothetical protein
MDHHPADAAVGGPVMQAAGPVMQAAHRACVIFCVLVLPIVFRTANLSTLVLEGCPWERTGIYSYMPVFLLGDLHLFRYQCPFLAYFTYFYLYIHAAAKADSHKLGRLSCSEVTTSISVSWRGTRTTRAMTVL